MRVKSGIGQHSYTIETPKSGVPGGTSVIVTRLTLTEAGWVRTGRMTFPNHAEALAKILSAYGFQREFPVNYGMSNVVEYWTEPAPPLSVRSQAVNSRSGPANPI